MANLKKCIYKQWLDAKIFLYEHYREKNVRQAAVWYLFGI